MAKTEKLFSKLMILGFLVLLILGFVIPGVINHTTPDQTAAEPRLCSTDADCYLICQDKPVNVLCSQNLCMQNTCEERSYYEFNPIPLRFTVNLYNLSLQERSTNRDLFVKFKGNKAQAYASGLVLYQVLEKAKVILDTQCLTFDGKQYCGQQLEMTVNGENSTLYGNYVLQEGDVVKIDYS